MNRKYRNITRFISDVKNICIRFLLYNIIFLRLILSPAIVSQSLLDRGTLQKSHCKTRKTLRIREFPPTALVILGITWQCLYRAREVNPCKDRIANVTLLIFIFKLFYCIIALKLWLFRKLNITLIIIQLFAL